MAIVCKSCGLEQDPDPSGRCPWCGAEIAAAAPRPAPAPLRRPPAAIPRPVRRPAPVAGARDPENPYAPPESSVHTVEAPVEIEGPPLANPWIRLAAVLLDGVFGMICVMPGLFICFYLMMQNELDEDNFTLAIYIVSFVFPLPLNIFQWYLLTKSGQTLGKKIVKIRILNYATGEMPGFGRAVALRWWVHGILCAIPCAGIIYALVDALLIFGEARRCIHDYIAGTKVVVA
jgi:uncharacterized RDD family membrane protein YckC